MASFVIHMAVANELNKTLKRDNKKLLIGTIAPDISKIIGENKIKSHFLDKNDDIPNLEKFLNKYKDKLDDDFVMGYYIHLFTDYLWFKYFITEFINENLITKLDNTVISLEPNLILQYIYNDYTNLNEDLIKEYDLNIDFFYENLPKLENIIEEIPMNKLNLIVDKSREIIENNHKNKSMIFNLEYVNQFIKMSVDIILSNLNELMNK